jgi:sigma-B regulation protein RsbU (phosphoserine phosphatase)
MILLLLISVFTGSLLAKTFITPVKELSRGVIALRNRDTNTILKIENKDELGHLGQAFNQMMSDIKDMLLAGAVQQCLIPTGKYKMEGYDCVVYNQMATDVGGDYADIFELPNDRVLIVIGDVTGHGVSSSLLTAMVKASVYRFANKNTTLNEIVTQTSNMIADLLNKKKLMTFCAITLDKKTGELSICNAGHPYPIIREKEIGLSRTPCKTSLPMGLSKKRCRYTTESELLKPEETLFLYTDGFPEAENKQGKEYGYNEFNQLITNTVITSAEALKNHLVEVFKEFHGEAELADDITFIILRRNPL